MTPRVAAHYLAWVLRLAGALLVLAWPFVFLPESWMATSHRALGLGEFPASTLVDYLTRSISVLYGIRGLVYLLLATDVARYLPVIRFFGWMDVVAGVLLIGIDLHAGLPLYWTLSEGPPLIGAAALILYLAKRAEPGPMDPP